MKRTIYILASLVVFSAPVCAQRSITLDSVRAYGYPQLFTRFRIVDNGAPVTSVDPARLKLLENGLDLPFQIACPDPAQPTASIAIGLERSLDSEYGRAQQAAMDFVKAMRFTGTTNNASFWSFATTIAREVDVVRDSLRLRGSIYNTTSAPFPFNGTALYETMHRAIEDIVQYGTEPNRAIVFFTDGNNNTAYFNRTKEDVIGRAKVDGVRVYVVAIGSNAGSQADMQTICRETDGLFFHVSNPGALDSVYSDILRPVTNNYWCTLVYTSPLCPNGMQRSVNLEYTTPQSEVVGTSIDYTAPYDSSKLVPFTFWASLKEYLADANDTIRIACGNSLSSDALMSNISVEIRHYGLTATGAELTGEFGDWTLTSTFDPGVTTLNFYPPAGYVASAGAHHWATLTLRAWGDVWSFIEATVIKDATQCFTSRTELDPGEYTVQLDTVTATRNSYAYLPARIIGRLPREGLTSAELTFEFDGDALDYELFHSGSVALPPGWHLTAAAKSRSGAVTTVRLAAQGPFTDTSIVIVPRLKTLPAVGYFNPVTLKLAVINVYDKMQQIHERPGLVILQDSCRNNAVIAQNGLFVRQPAPNPVSAAVSFTLSSPAEERVEISIFNALGVLLAEREAIESSAAKREWTCDVSRWEEGLYYFRFTSASGEVTHPVYVFR